MIDPRVARTLPAQVVAASGMDVLCHALESFTARRFSSRAAPASPIARPMSQGANPWSDLGCREALRLCGAHLAARGRADDREAREQMMWAATLAGIAFGNAGVHVPHAMAYAIAGQVREFRSPGYPDAPLVPHGIAVAIGAPAVFRATGATSPARHLEAAALLGADVRGASDGDAGERLAAAVIAAHALDRDPERLAAVGYRAADVPALVAGARAAAAPARQRAAANRRARARSAVLARAGVLVTEPRARPTAADYPFVTRRSRRGGSTTTSTATSTTSRTTASSTPPRTCYLISEAASTSRAGDGDRRRRRIALPVSRGGRVPRGARAGVRVDKLGTRAVTYGIAIFSGATTARRRARPLRPRVRRSRDAPAGRDSGSHARRARAARASRLSYRWACAVLPRSRSSSSRRVRRPLVLAVEAVRRCPASAARAPRTRTSRIT